MVDARTATVLSALLVVFAFCGCGDRQNQSNRSDELKKQSMERSAATVNKLLYGEKAALLAAKHQQEEQKIFDMIVESNDVAKSYYRNKQYVSEGKISMDDMAQRLGKITKDDIGYFANKYGIQKKTVAEVFVDYRAMTVCDGK